VTEATCAIGIFLSFAADDGIQQSIQNSSNNHLWRVMKPPLFIVVCHHHKLQAFIFMMES
jgi:hypothetical protein